MKIGVDLDGVVYDFINPFDRFMREHGLPVDESQYGFRQRYKIPSRVGKDLLQEFGDKNPFRWIPREQFAKQKLEKLSKNNQLIIVTWRDWHRDGIEDTLWRLKNDDIPYDDVIFTDKKAKYASELGLNVMLEDNLDTAKAIMKASNCQVILFDHDYNRQGRPPISDGFSVVPGWSASHESD